MATRNEVEITTIFVNKVKPFAKFQRENIGKPDWSGFNVQYQEDVVGDTPQMVSSHAVLAVSDEKSIPASVHRSSNGEIVVDMLLSNDTPNRDRYPNGIEIPVSTLEKLNPVIKVGGAKSYKKRFNRSNRSRRGRITRRGRSNKK